MKNKRYKTKSTSSIRKLVISWRLKMGSLIMMVILTLNIQR
jgi:hypothetical protein